MKRLFTSFFPFLVCGCASRHLAWDPLTAQVQSVPSTQIYFQIPGIEGTTFHLTPSSDATEFTFVSPLRVRFNLSFTTNEDLLLTWGHQSHTGRVQFCAPSKAWVEWGNPRGETHISHANFTGAQLCQTPG
jgi:hypothetical protein